VEVVEVMANAVVNMKTYENKKHESSMASLGMTTDAV
jgi:hypothetical protein